MPARRGGLAARLAAGFVALLVLSGPSIAPAGAATFPARRPSAAQRVLAEARAWFRRDHTAVASEGRIVDATAILRDLVIHLPELSRSERHEASIILSRPTDGPSGPAGYSVPAVHACTQRFCVHWVRSTSDSPSLGDANHNRRPDYIDRVIGVMNRVWRTEIGTFGYRRPKSDRASRHHGPNARIDVYIADVGAAGYYGYCTSDDPNAANGYRFGDLSAYLVFDNDFRAGQFPGIHGTRALQVTAAHEFFHSVQFAYDAYDDIWLMEGTAVWMEDEVYDGVNDSLQYLKESPLRQPAIALDRGTARTTRIYGSWIFFRHLSEAYGRVIVRDIWRGADASRGGPDRYSATAINAALKKRGSNMRTAFAAFGAKNAYPDHYYNEGASYPMPPRAQQPDVGDADTPSATYDIDHLATTYVRFTPALGNAGTQLQIVLHLPPRVSGPEARAIVLSGGQYQRTIASLDANGDGTIQVPFDPTVTEVVLELSNGSIRYRCGRAMPYSCRGRPIDDDRNYHYDASVV
jgi:hypothetical protein